MFAGADPPPWWQTWRFASDLPAWTTSWGGAAYEHQHQYQHQHQIQNQHQHCIRVMCL